jgi:hypothetical protein
MPSISVDVFRLILEHVDRADLAKICLLNKICCSYSRDVLYREIKGGVVCLTLAQSTHLAKRVRSFVTYEEHPSLAKALRNMSSLRRLRLRLGRPMIPPTLLEGCSFKLDSLAIDLPFCEPLRKFLNSQPSLTCVSFIHHSGSWPFEETCLPILTRVTAESACLSQLIPGRPVSEVTLIDRVFVAWSHFTFFTLSTVPIWKLEINYWFLRSCTTLAPFAPILPLLTHLTLSISFSLSYNPVCKLFYWWKRLDIEHIQCHSFI